jgi:hypothetical protein
MNKFVRVATLLCAVAVSADDTCKCLNLSGQTIGEPGYECMGAFTSKEAGTWTEHNAPNNAPCRMKFEAKHKKWVLITAENKVAMEVKAKASPQSLLTAHWHGKDEQGSKIPAETLKISCYTTDSDCNAAFAHKKDVKHSKVKHRRVIHSTKIQDGDGDGDGDGAHSSNPTFPTILSKQQRNDQAFVDRLRAEGKIKDCASEVGELCGPFAVVHPEKCWMCVKNHLFLINSGLPHMCPLSTIGKVCRITDPKLLALSENENPTCEKQLHVFCKDLVSQGEKCHKCVKNNLQQITSYLPGDYMCSTYQMQAYCSDKTDPDATKLEKKFMPGMQKYLKEREEVCYSIRNSIYALTTYVSLLFYSHHRC